MAEWVQFFATCTEGPARFKAPYAQFKKKTLCIHAGGNRKLALSRAEEGQGGGE